MVLVALSLSVAERQGMFQAIPRPYVKIFAADCSHPTIYKDDSRGQVTEVTEGARVDCAKRYHTDLQVILSKANAKIFNVASSPNSADFEKVTCPVAKIGILARLQGLKSHQYFARLCRRQSYPASKECRGCQQVEISA